MVYFELFFSFMKIGFTSFGGMSMIPLILEEMQAHHWMSAQELADLVAIAEMTPGPLGINCATFAGTQAAGISGGLAAVAGVLTPAYTLAILTALCFQKVQKSELMVTVMEFVKPVWIGMVFGVMVTLGKETWLTDGRVDLFGMGIGALMFVLLTRRKWSVPKVIAASAACGILVYGLPVREWLCIQSIFP